MMKKKFIGICIYSLILISLSACISNTPLSPHSSPMLTSTLTTNTQIPSTPTFISATSTQIVPAQTQTPTIEITDSPSDHHENGDAMQTNNILITIGTNTLTATLVENSSTAALKDQLRQNPLTIEMRDYGNMEKVGSFGMEFPRNDQQITTEPGDLILYQGSAFVIYYAPNSWNFTRLGKIDNISAQELKNILGNGDVTVTLSLP